MKLSTGVLFAFAALSGAQGPDAMLTGNVAREQMTLSLELMTPTADNAAQHVNVAALMEQYNQTGVLPLELPLLGDMRLTLANGTERTVHPGCPDCKTCSEFCLVVVWFPLVFWP